MNNFLMKKMVSWRLLRVFFLPIFLFILSGGIVSCQYYDRFFSQQESEVKYIVRIDNQIIEQDFFKQYVKIFLQNLQLNVLDITEKELNDIKKIVLDQIVEDIVIYKEIKRLDFSINIKEIEEIALNTFNSYKQNLNLNFQEESDRTFWLMRHKNFLVKRKFFDFLIESRAKITEQDLRKYYNEHSAEFIRPIQHEILHIQVESKDLADFVYSSIINKKASFESMVANYSISPDKSIGGSLGFIKENALPSIFNEVIFKLTLKNNISKIVESRIGYHIFKLNDILPAKQPNYREVHDILKDRFVKQQAKDIYKQWEEETFQIYEIFINEAAANKTLIL